MSVLRLAILIVGLAAAGTARAETISISVDAARDRHPISPLIYGASFADTAALKSLRAPLNRAGGNSASRYNWRLNARNAGKDFFYESLPAGDSMLDRNGDSFVALSRAGGSQAMITVPMLGWVARLGPQNEKLASFSIRKYGPQKASDAQWFPDAGNGIGLDGKPIAGNDPNDANLRDTLANEEAWVRHLVTKWGGAAAGGVKYYLLDNEPSIWHLAHRDVQPTGAHAREIAKKSIDHARMIKAADPRALVVGPEEWGWNGYRYSGFDQQYGSEHGWSSLPDRQADLGGQDYLPWLLGQWKAAGRPVDVLSVHYYPEGGEYGDDISEQMQLRRNRSTRSLWDPAYVDESWIADKVALIPRLKQWAAAYYYADTPVAITEYNWGAEKSINGATTQADILGIFGREGLALGARWVAPAAETPTFKAMQMYRNYDSRGGEFGDTSIFAGVPNPDELSAFAALRSRDGRLTLMVVNKVLTGSAAAVIEIAHFAPRGSGQVYRLTAANRIDRLPDISFADGHIDAALPAQSVTLFVLNAPTPAATRP